MIDLRALRSPPRGKGKNEMKEMPSLFLCHASVDKPFVEKLANDLKGAGVNVWFDQWNIRVGESITWKIDEGIRENEYLSIVMSPESVNSEWVKTELGAAWNKQMATRKIVVLPVLYRDCAIPAILADRKYADFRSDYNRGFRELTAALGLVGEAILSADNWRDYRAQSDSGWQKFREKEFRQLVTRIVDRAKAYHWGFWVGASKNPFSFTVSAIDGPKKSRYVSVKLVRDTYMACNTYSYNPNDLKASDYNITLGNTVESVEEFVWPQMEDYRREYGDPQGHAFCVTTRMMKEREKWEVVKEVTDRLEREMDWYGL